MINKKIIPLLMILLFSLLGTSYAREVSFTQEDRERLIRLETKVDEGLRSVNQRLDEGLRSVNQRLDEGLRSVNQRIDDINKRIDDLRDLIYVVIGGMIALVGFVIWDRRTALQPAVRKNKELEERQERIERALKELAKKDPDLAEILKGTGLL